MSQEQRIVWIPAPKMPQCCNCPHKATQEAGGVWHCGRTQCEAQAVIEAEEQGYGPLAASLRAGVLVVTLALCVLLSGCMSQADITLILLESRVRVLEDRADWADQDAVTADWEDWADMNQFQD